MLSDLDLDLLECIVRHVPWWDRITVALQSKQMLSVCANIADTDPVHIPSFKQWATLAVASSHRLRWAVKEMGYSITWDTLREAAFRGKLKLYKKLCRKLRTDAIPDEVYRHAGASGCAGMIKWMRKRAEEGGDGDNEVMRRRTEMLRGMVAYNRADAFRDMFDSERDTPYATEYVQLCIKANADLILSVLLEVLPTEQWTRRNHIELAVNVCLRNARPYLLSMLHTSFTSQVNGPWITKRQEYGGLRSLFFGGSRIARPRCAFVHRVWETDWKYYAEDLPKAQRLDTLSYVVERMGVSIPLEWVPCAVVQADCDVLRYIHENLHPVRTWEAGSWKEAFIPIHGNHLNFFLARFVHGLDPTVRIPDGVLLRVLQYVNDDRQLQILSREITCEKMCAGILDWCLKRGAVWTEACTHKVVRRGSLNLLLWMRGHGLPVTTSSSSLLESAMHILDARQEVATCVIKCKMIVHYLVRDCHVPWTDNCLRIASLHCVSDPEHPDTQPTYDLLLWMVNEMGAPAHHLPPRPA